MSKAKPMELKAGVVVYRQNQKSAPRFYIIESGRVKVSISQDDGSEKILAIQERNTIFGEASAFDGHDYFATATTLESSRLQVVEVDDFLNLLRYQPTISVMIINALARAVRMLAFQVEDLSFLDAHKRVAHMVFKLTCEVGEKTPNGIIIQKKVTHEELAHLTGLSRVSVSLALNKFEELRILRKKRHMIEVTDIEALKQLMAK